MPRRPQRLGLLAVLGVTLFAGQAMAQFGQIFGGQPPRPPAEVAPRASAPAPLGLPQQMPPEEMDDDVAPPPARALPPQRQPAARAAPPGAARSAPPPPSGISSQPLAPPPGASAVAPAPAGQPAAAATAMPPAQPAVPPPGQRQMQRGGSTATAALQPGDEVITELPTQKIPNPTAVFTGLDKITGRIITFEVALNETVQFGALQVTPRVCYTRPPTEPANTDTFVDVDEVTLQGEVKRIFTGWMFASSPGLHAVEHPIYDVWLTDCKGGTTAVADAPPAAGAPSRTPSQQRAPAQPRTQAPAPGGRQAVQQPTLTQPQPPRQPPQFLQPQPQFQQPANRAPPPPNYPAFPRQ